MEITPKQLERAFAITRRDRGKPPLEYLATVAAMLDGLPNPEAYCTMMTPAGDDDARPGDMRWTTLAICGEAFVRVSATGPEHEDTEGDYGAFDTLTSYEGGIRPFRDLMAIRPLEMGVAHTGWSMNGHADVRVRTCWLLEFADGSVVVRPDGSASDWKRAHAFARAVKAKLARR